VRSFTFHERSGWGSILACILVLLVAESIGLHLFLWHRSVIAALVVTVSDIYVIVWLILDYRAMRLRPTTIDDRALHFRFGLRWFVTIDRDNIAAVEPVRGESDWKRKDVLKLAIMDEPTLIVRLHQPVVAMGPAGIKKRIVAVAVLPDDLDGFKSAIA